MTTAAMRVSSPVVVEHDHCRNEGLAHASWEAHKGVLEQRLLHHAVLVVADGHVGGIDPVPGQAQIGTTYNTVLTL